MENSGFFYCPVCGKQTAVWQNDFTAEEAGYLEPGLVTFYLCSNCGAFIEAYIPDDPPSKTAAE